MDNAIDIAIFLSYLALVFGVGHHADSLRDIAVVVYADCIPTPGEEECELDLNDGIDNDCNGLIDMNDPGCDGWFRPGDCNRDRQVDISDGIGLLSWLFTGGPAHFDGSRCRVVINCDSPCWD